MKILTKNEYNLYFITNDDIVNNVFLDKKYIILLQIDNDLDVYNVKKNIKIILNKNCHEIFCIGKFSEKMHDILEDYVVDLTMEDPEYSIITTWDSEDNIDDSCHYFIIAIGEKICKDYYALTKNVKVKKYLKKYFLKIGRKGN